MRERAGSRQGCSASKKCRREGLLNQAVGHEDVVSFRLSRGEHRVPSMCCCCCGRLVSPLIKNPCGRAEQGSSHCLMCRSCWNRSLQPEQDWQPFTPGPWQVLQIKAASPAPYPAHLLDTSSTAAGCKTTNGGISIYQVPNKWSGLMHFPGQKSSGIHGAHWN